MNADMWAHVRRTAAWIDEQPPVSWGDKVGMQVVKLAEETGEVADAYIGWTGQNPRKGRYASADDVGAEFCDVIVTAMHGLVRLYPPGRAEEVLEEHFRKLEARMSQ